MCVVTYSSIPGVVITVREEVVVAGEGGVSLEMIVAIETELVGQDVASESGPVGGVAAEGELARADEVTVLCVEPSVCFKRIDLWICTYEPDAGKGEEVSQVVTNIVQVLLSVDKLVVCRDAVSSQELSPSSACT